MSEKQKRGFAVMDKEKQREIARRGGKAAQAKGAHRWTSEEARAAGKKGGKAAHRGGRAHTFSSEEARAASVKGVANRKKPSNLEPEAPSE